MTPLDLRPISMQQVAALCAAHHGYGSAGNVAAYAFGVFEGSRIVAAYAWQPPPRGVALAVAREAPHAVLSLSRMVAVPKTERHLKHVSKPLREQMKRRIDRTRWPVLVTFSDEGQGHTGYVYACSGWTPTEKRVVTTYLDASGRRASRYANGETLARPDLTRGPDTTIQRWEHWACPRGKADQHLAAHGWRRVATKQTWASGATRYRWERDEGTPLLTR